MRQRYNAIDLLCNEYVVVFSMWRFLWQCTCWMWCWQKSRMHTTQPQQPLQQSSSRFKGNCLSLKGQVFDCLDYKQADKYQSTIKQISEYVGSEFKHRGNICSSIVNEVKITILLPMTPTVIDPLTPTVPEQLLLMIFKGEVMPSSRVPNQAHFKAQGKHHCSGGVKEFYLTSH